MSLAMNHAKEIGKKEAMDFLKSHKRFLLVGHEHPDGDDVHSLLVAGTGLEPATSGL